MHLMSRKAALEDLPYIIALLLEDELGQTRESTSEVLDARYVKAFYS